MKNDNASLSSSISGSTDSESKSKTSSFSSINMATLTSLTNNLVKSCDWLYDLLELHYFAYNSCNSLTIYSYKYLPSLKKILVSTKENNIKEIYFELFINEDGAIGGAEHQAGANPPESALLSTRSSLSSGNSNPNTRHVSANNDDVNENIRKASTGHPDTKSNLSFNEPEGSYLEPIYKIHKLPKIKVDALISSIDAFEINGFIVLSVTLALKVKPEQYLLHIYCDFETNDLELITECEHEFELNAMPHRVTNLKHVKIIEEADPVSQSKRLSQVSSNFVFVNCSQKKNLLYSIDIPNRKFQLVKRIDDYFAELSPDILNENICSHDIKHISSGNSHQNLIKKTSQLLDRRLTAIGSQNGWLGVYLVDAEKNEILKQWEYENDSFLTQLQFFTAKSISDWSKLDIDKTPINLLVLRSLEPTRIFNNVLHSDDGYEGYQDLEISNNCDLVTSAVIYDATFSGYNSIVLGTFGRFVLFFCPTMTNMENYESGGEGGGFRAQAPPVVQNDLPGDVVSDRRSRHVFTYEFKREIVFKHSVLGLLTGLITNNGALDLVILTLNGVSVWQYDPEKVIDLANKLFEQREHLDNLKENSIASCSNNDLTTSF